MGVILSVQVCGLSLFQRYVGRDIIDIVSDSLFYSNRFCISLVSILP